MFLASSLLKCKLAKKWCFHFQGKKYFSLEKPTQRSHNAHARDDQFSEKLWFWYFDVALNTFGSGAVKQSQSCHKGQPKAGKGWWGGGRGEGGFPKFH